MANEKTGLEIAREKNQQLKQSIAEDKAKAVNASSLIAQANLSEEVMAYMLQNSVNNNYEDLNTGMSMPQLRIHSAGNSTKNQLEDGNDPKDGQIFYTGTKKAVDVATVIILAIKKCRLLETDEKGKAKVDENGNERYSATYLVAGVMDGTFDPFLMYVKGMSYNKIWDLEEKLKPFVTKRKGGIPLNMVKILVSSEKERVQNGPYKGQAKNVFKFDLKMAANGYPVLEVNFEYLKKLDQITESAELALEDTISRKGMTEKEWNLRGTDGGELLAAAHETFTEVQPEAETNPPEPTESDKTQDIDPDDIPF